MLNEKLNQKLTDDIHNIFNDANQKDWDGLVSDAHQVWDDTPSGVSYNDHFDTAMTDLMEDVTGYQDPKFASKEDYVKGIEKYDLPELRKAIKHSKQLIR